MKRMESSDSLGGLLPIFPPSEEQKTGGGYGRGFPSILDGFVDEDDCGEDQGIQVAEKKRRLTVDQVKALEKNFELENKLEPERKVKLAQELGLQPRQVAVWFQNRRARWKTKQLERDYGTLKASYETLKASYESLQTQKESLVHEVHDLKEKLEGSGIVMRDSQSQQEEIEMVAEEEIRPTEQRNDLMMANDDLPEINNTIDHKLNNVRGSIHGGSILGSSDIKDGSDDSDSSAILNDDNSPHRHAVADGSFTRQFSNSPLKFNFSTAPPSSSPSSSSMPPQRTFHQFLRMDEHNFLNSEESCNFFNDEQPPTMPWYFSDQWT